MWVHARLARHILPDPAIITSTLDKFAPTRCCWECQATSRVCHPFLKHLDRSGVVLSSAARVGCATKS